MSIMASREDADVRHCKIQENIVPHNPRITIRPLGVILRRKGDHLLFEIFQDRPASVGLLPMADKLQNGHT